MARPCPQTICHLPDQATESHQSRATLESSSSSPKPYIKPAFCSLCCFSPQQGQPPSGVLLSQSLVRFVVPCDFVAFLGFLPLRAITLTVVVIVPNTVTKIQELLQEEELALPSSWRGYRKGMAGKAQLEECVKLVLQSGSREQKGSMLSNLPASLQ